MNGTTANYGCEVSFHHSKVCLKLYVFQMVLAAGGMCGTAKRIKSLNCLVQACEAFTLSCVEICARTKTHFQACETYCCGLAVWLPLCNREALLIKLFAE